MQPKLCRKKCDILKKVYTKTDAATGENARLLRTTTTATRGKNSGDITAAMDGDESQASLYRVLVDRFRSLEVSQSRIREQLHVIGEEQGIEYMLRDGVESDFVRLTSYSGPESAIGAFQLANPYRSMLESMGHALLVSRAVSGEIIFWNRAAEKLYGYKEWEVIGQSYPGFLTEEEHYASAINIMEKLRAGQSWAGQFPFRKRSGEVFMALVTKSPLYDDGELVGVITVSSDAAVYNKINSENIRVDQSGANGQPALQGLNMKKIQWHHPQPQISSMPQIASSVSNLALKVRLWSQGDDKNNDEIVLDSQDVTSEKLPKTPVSLNSIAAKVRFWSQRDDKSNEEIVVVSQDVTSKKPPERPPTKPRFATFGLRIGKNTADARSSEKDDESTFAQPSKLAAKVLSKFRIGNFGKDKDESIQQNGSTNISLSNKDTIEPKSPTQSNVTTSYQCVVDTKYKERNSRKRKSSYNVKRSANIDEKMIPIVIEETVLFEAFPRKPSEFLEGPPHLKNSRPSELDYATQRPGYPRQIPSPGEKELNLIGECEIWWEDLQLQEEIGQGSYAVVYRGIWNGSMLLLSYILLINTARRLCLTTKKEIYITRKLRHPNVLLYMGAVYSQEKLAMVTEFLPRGSLFKILHRNSQTLDIRRRLRMALDVARGMNYLHHKNPPIVHRDLKSSNLLVDRNWTVKVGDFGLSKMKNSTFLTARSGTGTPQWMSPEVLRNEPSNEKSDVFSFGVILWELMTRSIPWNTMNPLQVVGVVGFMDRRLDIPDSIDLQISSVIHNCWQSNMEHRPSFEEVIQTMTDLIQAISRAHPSRKNSDP